MECTISTARRDPTIGSRLFLCCKGCEVNLYGILVRNVKDKNKIDMKWLTLDYIKQHSRIDIDCEDELLELYGEDAEDTVLNLINRSYEEVMELWGSVPKPLYVAALMLVEVDYNHRSPDSINNMYAVKYGFDMKIKPYIRLSGSYGNSNNTGYGKCKNL